ncbi:hypothetical protein [Streptomyces sp. NPDC001978]|uniref:hypothetical protein n=1 Tax=Streptomyces sp. NPDC001978 TaxID=3364627 RepID=UPI00369DF7AB
MSVLEFISSLKWLVTLLILVVFISWRARRNPDLSNTLKTFVMSRNFRLQAFGADVEATRAEVETAVAGALAARTDEELAEAAEPAASGEPDVAQLRREAVEAVMTSAAHWGWSMAQMGFKNPPNPAIRWDEEGQPKIVFGSSDLTRRVIPAAWARRTLKDPEEQKVIEEWFRLLHSSQRSTPPETEPDSPTS